MAELILACVRDPRTRALDGDALRSAALRIEPAGDAPLAPLLIEHGGVLAAAPPRSTAPGWSAAPSKAPATFAPSGDGACLVLAAMAAEAGAEPGLGERARVVLQPASGLLPIRLAAALRPGWNALSLGAPALAFRAVLARRTIALFEDDAQALDGPRPAAARRVPWRTEEGG